MPKVESVYEYTVQLICFEDDRPVFERHGPTVWYVRFADYTLPVGDAEATVLESAYQEWLTRKSEGGQ